MQVGAERLRLVDLGLVLVALIGFDGVAFGVGVPVIDRTDVLCSGLQCYLNPYQTINNVHLHLWLTAGAALVAVALSLYLRRARVLTIGFQLVLVAVMLAVMLPRLHDANTQLRDLENCQVGAAHRCHGVTRLS